MPMFMTGVITNALFTIGLTDGVGVRVGSATAFDASVVSPADLAWDGTTLFLIASSGFYSVDRATGVATPIGSASNFGQALLSTIVPSGLAWDGTTMFMTGVVERDAYLFTMDRTTGVATQVAEIRWNFGGPSSTVSIEWDGSTMFALSDDYDRLFTLSRTTAGLTVVANVFEYGISESGPQTMAWDGTTMFMTGTSLDALLSINLTSAVATRIGVASRFGVGEVLATGFAWVPDTQVQPLGPGQAPESQFEGYDEFTLLYDITRGSDMIADEVEMLIESGVDSRFYSIAGFTLAESLALHTLTPRFPIPNVMIGDMIAASSGQTLIIPRAGSFTVTGFAGIAAGFRQKIIVQQVT